MLEQASFGRLATQHNAMSLLYKMVSWVGGDRKSALRLERVMHLTKESERRF